MSFEITQGTEEGYICLTISSLRTRCPHTGGDDITRLEIKYKPGAYFIAPKTLMDFIKDEIEGKAISMESIPVKLMDFLIKDLTMNKPGKRDAAPEELIISSESRGLNKKFTIKVDLNFQRKIV